jgi:hypothetical protein
MRDLQYKFEIAPSFMSFEFVSEGPKGRIPKVVKYTEIEHKGIYNLGFGDKKGLDGEYDDTVISDNKDSLRVLATVAATVLIFTQYFPDAYVYAEGSNRARTRLYRIGISNHLEEINADFIALGY